MSTQILCYHSHRIVADNRVENDHIAMCEDLDALETLGVKIVPLSDIVDDIVAGRHMPKAHRAAITFDDGADFDIQPCESRPDCVPGFYSILKSRSLRGTAFVIASPVARACLEAANRELGLSLTLSDAWWADPDIRALIDIGQHSFDHNHEACAGLPSFIAARGNFFAINNLAAAKYEIEQAQELLRTQTGELPQHFAYPFGHVSPYLRDQYFPNHGTSLGLTAAFSTGDAPVTSRTNRWEIPRIVCGQHWRSADQLLSRFSIE